jgi:ligand-binding sensor domain-containing protein/serine phosphatase RsbU (regulator of sigma subunit)
VYQDSRGNLWLGTQAGLTRYNGQDFYPFSKKNEVLGQVIFSIYEDSQQRLWFATEAGLNCYDGKTVKTYKKQDYANFFGLFEDKYKGLWVNAYYRGRVTRVMKIVSDSLIDITLKHKDTLSTKNGLSSMAIGRPNAGVYINNVKGIFEYDNGKLSFAKLNAKSLADKDPQSIFNLGFIDNTGHYWLSYRNKDNRVSVVKVKDSSIKKLSYPTNFRLGLNTLSRTFEDNQGNVWIPSQAYGVLCYTKGGTTKVFNKQNGLPANDLACVGQDREGNIWLGTVNTGYGALKYTGARFKLYDKRDGLDVTTSWSFLQDSKNNIWAGMNRQIAQYDGKRFKVSKLFKNRPIRISFIKELANKTIIAGCSQGLYEWNGQTWTIATQKYGLPVPPGRCYVQKDTLWFSLFNGQFVKTYQNKIIEDSTWTSVQLVGQATDINRDAKGVFWIASITGLYRYDGKKLTLFNKSKGLKANFVCQTAFDKWGRLWIACMNGLNWYVDGKIKQVPIHLSSEMIYSLTIDKQQNVWLGTQNGLSKIELDAQGKIKSVKLYGKEQGVVFGEPDLAANYVGKDDKLWFGGVDGIIEYNPAADTNQVVAPEVNLTKVKLDLKTIDWNAKTYAKYHQGASPWFAIPQKLTLPYYKNNISFDFEALCFHATDSVSFQWKLEGIYNEWSPITNSREAVYTNLPSGKYVFWVRTKNQEGMWSAPQKFAFEIQTPFWQELWFKVVALLAIVGLVYLIFRARIRHIKKQKERLEKLVDQKTAEIVQHRDEILEKNEELSVYAEETAAQAENLRIANEEIIRKNEDITSSISYAERIQSAILPELDLIKKELPQSFVFFKPRDIVSGDFYWFTASDTHIVLAAVDCTGHGVPGAFMSLIGNDLLNHIVTVQKIWEPAAILSQLHLQVRESLKQERTNNRDGMDMSVVVIDKSAQTLHFAGAKNSLVYFQQGELFKIKGDKMPIGGEQREQERQFTSHQISLATPTTFYLFSDGFQDQFGGQNGKKFMVPRFRELLQKIHQEPIDRQANLLEASLQEWMKGTGQEYKQLDDILVIGVHWET